MNLGLLAEQWNFGGQVCSVAVKEWQFGAGGKNLERLP